MTPPKKFKIVKYHHRGDLALSEHLILRIFNWPNREEQFIWKQQATTITFLAPSLLLNGTMQFYFSYSDLGSGYLVAGWHWKSFFKKLDIKKLLT